MDAGEAAAASSVPRLTERRETGRPYLEGGSGANADKRRSTFADRKSEHCQSARSSWKSVDRANADRGRTVQRQGGERRSRNRREANAVVQLEQGLLAGVRLHKARTAGVLLPDGGLHSSLSAQSCAGIATVSGRHQRAIIFPERRARRNSRLVGNGGDQLRGETL